MAEVIREDPRHRNSNKMIRLRSVELEILALARSDPELFWGIWVGLAWQFNQ